MTKEPSDPPQESSGYLVEYQGERVPITGVIHVMEMQGEEARAKLLKTLRATILATRKTKELAIQLVNSYAQKAP